MNEKASKAIRSVYWRYTDGRTYWTVSDFEHNVRKALSEAGLEIREAGTATQPDLCYVMQGDGDGETWTNRDAIADISELDEDGVVKVGCLAELPARYAVPIADAEGVEYWRWFETREDALRAASNQKEPADG